MSSRTRLTSSLSALFALAVAPLSLGGCGILEVWECGYGGPGCGEPRLVGVCEATLVVDAPVPAMVVFHDDTGSHEATLLDYSSDASDLLELAPAEGEDAGEGSLMLTPLAPGEVTLTLEVEGWDVPRSWTLMIVDAPDSAPPDDDETGDETGDETSGDETPCELVELDPDSASS